MKPITLEWVLKAEADFATVERECRARRSPNYDGACFHAQQAAEKYLKGYLVAKAIEFRCVHELAYLVRLCMGVESDFSTLLPPAAELQDYATDVRYPPDESEVLTQDDAREAVQRAHEVRDFVRQALPEA